MSQVTRYRPGVGQLARPSIPASVRRFFSSTAGQVALGSASGESIRQLGEYNKRQQKAQKKAQKKKRKARSLYSKVVEGHGDITFSKFKVNRRPKNKLEKRLASVKGKITRRYVNSFKLQGPSGRQRMDHFAYFEREHIKKIIEDAWNNQSLPEGGRPIDWVTNTPVSISPGGDVTRNDLTPFLHKSNHGLTLTNFENASVSMTIYDLVCIKDTDLNPNACVRAGLQTMGETAQDDNHFGIGVNPRQSRVFNERWKVLKVTQLTMKPGENHKHYIDVNVNQTVSATRLQEGTKIFLAGVSRAVLTQVEGVLITSNANPALVSTAPTAIGIMWNRNYSFSINSSKHRVMYPPVDPLPVITDGRLIQEDGDAVTTVNV